MGALLELGPQPVGIGRDQPLAWPVEHRWARAGSFHVQGTEQAGEAGRLVSVHHLSDRALVLGSTQPLAQVDIGAAERAGVEVVRRRSGGGAVLLEPGGVVWVDVVVPSGDPLWEQDVGRAFWWLGDAWAAALRLLGFPDVRVHRGSLQPSRWDAVCFAGLGPGEVTVGGRKVLGLAQRRTRQGALFQCALPLRPEPERIVPLLALDPDERDMALSDLTATVGWLHGVTGDQVASALVRNLP